MTPPLARRQRGAASLIVVAVLFFVLSLVAAYTNRNLIFEQRTGANQYRSTQAFEAAEAGVEWALTMLNAGRIDDNCLPSADPVAPSFRSRYLAIDVMTNGRIEPAGALTPLFESTVWAGCVFDGIDWSCTCPDAAGGAAAAAPAAPVGVGVFPAFRVRFSRATLTQPSVVRLEVNGCTRLDDDCLRFPAQAVAGEGRATVSTLIALRSALPVPPVAALTVQRDIDLSGGDLRVFNTDIDAGGISILAGGNSGGVGSITVGGPPGTAPGFSPRFGQTDLENMPVERPDPLRVPPFQRATVFTQTLGIWPHLYRDQPATVRLDCSAGCDAQAVRDAWAANPGRVLWADGDLTLDGGGDIGTPDDPMLLVVAGDDDNGDGSTDAEIEVNVELHGLLYVYADRWTVDGNGVVHGAAIGDGELVVGGGSFAAVYARATLQRLRWASGSFVRVPGSWRDF